MPQQILGVQNCNQPSFGNAIARLAISFHSRAGIDQRRCFWIAGEVHFLKGERADAKKLVRAYEGDQVFGWHGGKINAPDSCRVIVRGGDNQGAVRAEGSRDDPVRMSLEDSDLLTAAGVPEPRRVILRGSNNPGAVRAEGS